MTYTWSATGPAAVGYSANGTNAAKSATATFTQAGVYNLTVTITDAAGLTATSSVSVTVNQTLSGIDVTPLVANLFNSNTQQFTAAAIDQFGEAMAVQPAISWTTDAGSVGSVDASGLYTAPASAIGTATVRASAGATSGAASVNVTWLKGDLNGDGRLTAADVSTMMTALVDLSSYQNNRGLSTADLATIADVDGDGQITNLDLQALISTMANAQLGGGSSSAAVAAAPTDLSGVSEAGGSTASPAVVEPIAGSKVVVNFSSLPLSDESESKSEPILTPEPVLAMKALEPVSIENLNPADRDREAAFWHHRAHAARHAATVDDFFSSDFFSSDADLI